MCIIYLIFSHEKLNSARPSRNSFNCEKNVDCPDFSRMEM
jgi:hypothetical protein